MNLTHPIPQTYDAVASRGRPTSAEVDELVADLLKYDDQAAQKAPALRRRIAGTIDTIVSFRDAGQSGEARRIAREHAAALADELGEYTPPGKSEGKTIEEIVAAIPRGI